MSNHWQHIEIVDELTFNKFLNHKTSFSTDSDLDPNVGILISCESQSRKIEGVYDGVEHVIRPLKCGGKSAPNKELRLYLDALNNDVINMIAVDGLMGTGKTSSVVEYMCDLLPDINKFSEPYTSGYKIIIAKPYINAMGEEYGFLPGEIDDKLDPSLASFIQYFDRYHKAGFRKLRQQGYIELLPLGFVRGLDLKDTILVADECQNTLELISLATRKSTGSKIIFLGDTSPFQIDRPGNTSKVNGLTYLVDLLSGATFFQHIEMKTLNHIVRGDEVKEVVRRLFKKYGENPQEWDINSRG